MAVSRRSPQAFTSLAILAALSSAAFIPPAAFALSTALARQPAVSPPPASSATAAIPAPPSPPSPPSPPLPPRDLTRPSLFLVGYAHLDTQWRWTYLDTIRAFIPDTLHHNFVLFDKYPRYVFNFSGSRRYEFMEEYYPQDFATLKQWVAKGRWFPCGSSVDENDANVPSAESQIRHALYGNRYFRRTFGVASDEFMLPDCFGFPAALPSVLAHCGITGFSTQKLTWGSVVPIPFKVGVWEGPDGKGVIAALDPGAYVGDVTEDLSQSPSWLRRINASGAKSGVFADYHYFGTGDQGGAPKEPTVAMVEQSAVNGAKDDAPIRIFSERADALFHAITPEQRARLPRYQGELELTEHSAGSISSQAYMKRWNRKNELLADAAEKASVAAWWLGGPGSIYDGARFERAWGLVLGSQMHDILPGTSVPLAYNLSWNDEVVAANQFAAMLTDAVGVVAANMDTRPGPSAGDSTSIVVFNPLGRARREVVEVEIPHAQARRMSGVIVSDPRKAYAEATSQLISVNERSVKVAILVDVPALGLATYTVQLQSSQDPHVNPLQVSPDARTLENERYAVKIDARGDIASIHDKSLDKELLSAPARIGLFYENPSQWPAWNQDWADRQKPATSYLGDTGTPIIRVVERGPARVAVEVVREAEGSTWTQRISLAAASARVEIDTTVDWNTRERSARAEFPLTASNPTATFDIQTGVIERGNSHERQYEYPFHQWLDLTDKSDSHGVSVMCDSKYACDKPSDNTVRLTLLYTPGVRGGYPDQATQDLGRHHVRYAIMGHAGDWRDGQTFTHAAAFNQPLIPFIVPAHDGPLGKEFSLVKVNDPFVSVMALKKAEDSDELVIRLREHSGKPGKHVRVALPAGIAAAREIDGQERPIGAARVENGELVTDIDGYSLRAFALTLNPPTTRPSLVRDVGEPVLLSYDTDVISTNADRADGAMSLDSAGVPAASYPAEQLPSALTVGGVKFALAGAEPSQPNAVAANGQVIKLSAPGFTRAYVLVASSDSRGLDVPVTFRVDGSGANEVTRVIPAWRGFRGQWDSRVWPGDVYDPRYPWDSRQPIGLTPGYIKQGEIAWFATHHHLAGDASGAKPADAVYQFCYLYKVAIDLPPGASAITLPDDARVKLFALTLTKEAPGNALPAAPLFDTLDSHEQGPPRLRILGAGEGASLEHAFKDTVQVAIEPGLYWQEGSMVYATGDDALTARSPAYTRPLLINASTSIRAATKRADGTLGPYVERRIEVTDITPPRITRVTPTYQVPEIRLDFSEPVQAMSIAHIRLDPPIEVQSVKLAPDARSAVVRLETPPRVDQPYTLHVAEVRDASPAANRTRNFSCPLVVHGPVLSLTEIPRERFGTTIQDTPDLPVKAADPWTINVFVRTDKQPANHTVLVGMGVNAMKPGQSRFLCKFASGVHFWSHNQDAVTRVPFDLGRWQMITATYDGATVRVYKDATVIAERAATFADDENAVHIAPLDPWDQRYQFKGDLSHLTIWNAALGEESLKALLGAGPK